MLIGGDTGQFLPATAEDREYTIVRSKENDLVRLAGMISTLLGPERTTGPAEPVVGLSRNNARHDLVSHTAGIGRVGG